MKVYRHKSGEMYKSGWVAPPSAKNGGEEFITEERLKEVRASGINLMQPCHSNFDDMKRLIEAAAKAGVDVIVPIENTIKADFDPNKIAFELEYYKNSENVLGISLLDEPGSISFDALNNTANKIRPYIGDKLLYVNHMPMYATAGQLHGGWWSPYEEEAASDDYYDFFNSFYEKVKEVKLASYDFYPFRHEKGVCDPRYFEQMCIAKKIATDHDLPLWNFTQVTSWNRDGVRNMTYSEMAWLNNTSLACGVTGLQYFCYWTPCDTVETFENAMISRDGKRTTEFVIRNEQGMVLETIPKMKACDVKATYAGHEVAVHTCTHPNLTELDEKEIVYQVEEDRKALSALVGYDVVGMAYPCGGTNNDNRVARIIKENTPIQYARTITSTYSFDLQENLLQFNPTIYWIEWQLFDVVEKFLAVKMDKPQVLYIWGHAFELDRGREISYEKLEQLCALLAGREELFFGTNREVFHIHKA